MAHSRPNDIIIISISIMRVKPPPESLVYRGDVEENVMRSCWREGNQPVSQSTNARTGNATSELVIQRVYFWHFSEESGVRLLRIILGGPSRCRSQQQQLTQHKVQTRTVGRECL